MTRDDINRVIDRFGQAAGLAMDAGFDAVELHFGHLYLPSSFLRRLINRRKDDYGGHIDNRSRFVREIAHRVREVVGSRIAITAKVNMLDGIPRGIGLQELTRTAQLLDTDCNLDAIELTQDSSVFKSMLMFTGVVPVDEWAKAFSHPMGTGMRLFGNAALGNYPYRDMFMLDAARQFVPILKNTKLILLGGITHRDHMVTALKEGFDYVAMGRALLREPDLVNRLSVDPHKSLQPQQQMHGHRDDGRTHCVLDPKQRYQNMPDRTTARH
jgi:2,4-dienoyl-CoA reductase-like NADH-dependent reductase (Old Yellow Enzyme family)